MKKSDTMKVSAKPGEAVPCGNTDWDALSTMSEEDVIAAAQADPDAQPMTMEELSTMRRVSPVKVLRHRLGMTQVEFAQAFQIPVATLRDWEQGRTTPDAPARALLQAIEREPETMRRLLGRAA